MMQEEIDETSE